MNYKQFVLAKTIEAFERFDPKPESLPQDVGQPSVAPEGTPVFSDDIMEQINIHKYKALHVTSFEAFLDLLQNIATDVGLNPAQDFDKLASVLNQYRVEKDLEPL